MRSSSKETGAPRARTRRTAVLCACVVVCALPTSVSASLPADIVLKGYVLEEPVLSMPPNSGSGDVEAEFLNFLRAREDLRWYATDSVTFALEVEAQWLQGTGACRMAGLIAPLSSDTPLLDLHAELLKEDSTCIEAAVDRLWVDVTHGNLQVTAGRQRVAWGTNLVWNPVDIFNPSPALSLDDETETGTDAVRAQYYVGPNSQFDVAWAPARESEQTSAAARFQLNHGGYDWMLIGGRRAQDAVAGFAWAGSVAGGGFRGEVLCGQPERDAGRSGGGLQSDEGFLNASVSGDFAWSNTLYLQAAVLYNSRGTTGDAGGLQLIESQLQGDLSPARCSIFGEVAKDLTPLWRVDVSGIVNPTDGSFGLLPSLRWSATTDLDVTLRALVPGGAAGTEFGDQEQVWTVSARYSF